MSWRINAFMASWGIDPYALDSDSALFTFLPKLFGSSMLLGGETGCYARRSQFATLRMGFILT